MLSDSLVRTFFHNILAFGLTMSRIISKLEGISIKKEVVKESLEHKKVLGDHFEIIWVS